METSLFLLMPLSSSQNYSKLSLICLISLPFSTCTSKKFRSFLTLIVFPFISSFTISIFPVSHRYSVERSRSEHNVWVFYWAHLFRVRGLLDIRIRLRRISKVFLVIGTLQILCSHIHVLDIEIICGCPVHLSGYYFVSIDMLCCYPFILQVMGFISNYFLYRSTSFWSTLSIFSWIDLMVLTTFSSLTKLSVLILSVLAFFRF